MICMHGLSLHPACRVCSVCGYYVEQAHFSKEPTFTKGAAGESAVAGQYVSDSHNGVRLANGRVYGGVRGLRATHLAQLCSVVPASAWPMPAVMLASSSGDSPQLSDV